MDSPGFVFRELCQRWAHVRWLRRVARDVERVRRHTQRSMFDRLIVEAVFPTGVTCLRRDDPFAFVDVGLAAGTSLRLTRCCQNLVLYEPAASDRT